MIYVSALSMFSTNVLSMTSAMIWTLLIIMVFYLPETAYKRYHLSAVNLGEIISDITLEYHRKDMHQMLPSLPGATLLSKFTGPTSRI